MMREAKSVKPASGVSDEGRQSFQFKIQREQNWLCEIDEDVSLLEAILMYGQK